MSPSSTLSQAEMVVYRATALQRQQEAQANLAAFRRRALDLAGVAAELLRHEYGVDRVLLFGSMARPERPISLRSDVDLAVSGLAPERYFAAVGRLQGLDADIAVDLLRIEDLPDRLRVIVEQDGVAL